MTERQFIDKNKKDWIAFSEMTEKGGDPDKYHELFIKVSGDLSYAQTHFPNRTVRWYLNSLVVQIFDRMRTKSKIDLKTVIQRYYKDLLPKVIVKNKNYFFLSFIVFVLSFIVGSYSTLQDKDYARQILGNYYISMTEENIAQGDPFAVYKNEEQSDMFLAITFNNTRVALLTFALGIFAGVGTLIVLINNGIMVGVFQTYFFTKGLLIDSLLTIWIHGTIEIISIIIAGAAGLILGGHIIKPGSYTRIQSAKLGARRALIVLLSTMPLFIVAGFFEGFLTRMTELPVWIKLVVILSSLFFMVYAYIVNPILYSKKHPIDSDDNDMYEIMKATAVSQNENTKLSFVKSSFIQFGDHFGFLFATIIVPLTLVFAVGLFLFIKYFYDTFDMLSEDYSFHQWKPEYIPLFIIKYLISISTIMVLVHLFNENKTMKLNIVDVSILLVISLLPILPDYLFSEDQILYTIPIYFFVTLPILGLYIYHAFKNESSSTVFHILNFFLRDFTKLFPTLVFSCFGYFGVIVATAGVLQLIKSVVSFESIFGDSLLGTLFFENVLSQFTKLILMILSIYIFTSGLKHIRDEYYAEGLRLRVMNFIKKSE